MSQSFDNFENQLPAIRQFSPSNNYELFFKEEALRFYTIAGTVQKNFPSIPTSVDERIVTHILLRSVIENFFKMLYIFEDINTAQTKLDSITDGFKRDYAKLLNEPNLPYKNKLEPAGSGWSSLKPSMDLRSMLTQVRNTQGNRLDYIYFIYRISSFDTHGNSLNSLFETSFGKTCNFPYLALDPVIDLISVEYDSIFQQIK